MLEMTQSAEGDSVSIIIPTFKEAQNIRPLVERIANLTFSTKQLELIIVDDNSQDGITDIVKELSPNYPWVKLIERNQLRSLSWSVLDGCKAARHHTLVVMDADLSHPPEKIPEMLSTLNQSKADFVIGSRYIGNGSTDENWPVRRRMTSQLAALSARILLATQVKDPLSGFFCLRKSTLLDADLLQPIGWKIGLELMIKCRCKQISEVPIHFSQRFLGKSKLSSKVAIEYLRHVFHLSAYRLKGCLSWSK